MGSLSQEVPNLLPVLSVLPESAVSAGFRLALALALDVFLALALASSGSVSPAVSGLSTRLLFWLALVASSVGTLRRAIVVPASSRSRLASMPAPTRSGATSLMRLHNQRADFGHALSLSTSTPNWAATTLRLLRHRAASSSAVISASSKPLPECQM